MYFKFNILWKKNLYVVIVVNLYLLLYYSFKNIDIDYILFCKNRL